MVRVEPHLNKIEEASPGQILDCGTIVLIGEEDNEEVKAEILINNEVIKVETFKLKKDLPKFFEVKFKAPREEGKYTVKVVVSKAEETKKLVEIVKCLFPETAEVNKEYPIEVEIHNLDYVKSEFRIKAVNKPFILKVFGNIHSIVPGDIGIGFGFDRPHPKCSKLSTPPQATFILFPEKGEYKIRIDVYANGKICDTHIVCVKVI